MAKPETMRKNPEPVGSDEKDREDSRKAEVMRFIQNAKERGSVTRRELEQMLLRNSATVEQLPDVMNILSETGVTVVENESDEAADISGRLELLCSNSSTIIGLIKIAEAQAFPKPDISTDDELEGSTETPDATDAESPVAKSEIQGGLESESVIQTAKRRRYFTYDELLKEVLSWHSDRLSGKRTGPTHGATLPNLR